MGTARNGRFDLLQIDTVTEEKNQISLKLEITSAGAQS